MIVKLKSLKKLPQVIIITETFFDENSNLSQLINLGYVPFRSDRKNINEKPCGGVALFILNSLSPVEVASTSIGNCCEITISNIFINGSPVKICGVYRSPSASSSCKNDVDSEFKNFLAMHLKDSHFIIAGDFNFPGINWEDLQPYSDSSAHFINTMCDLNAHQLVNFPTRKDKNSGVENVLDLVFTNIESSVVNLKSDLPFYTSDHLSLTFDIIIPGCKTNVDSHLPSSILNFNKINVDGFKNYVNNINWHERLSSYTDPDEMYAAFLDALYEGFLSFVPKKKYLNQRAFMPWYNDHLHRLFRQRDRWWARYLKRGKRSVDLEKFYKVSRKCHRKMLFYREQYEELLSRTNNIRSLCSYAKNRMKYRESIPGLMRQDGTLAINNNEKAELFNDFFGSVFTKDNGIPCDVKINNYPELKDIHFSPDSVKLALSKIRPHSSGGPDYVNPTVLSLLKDELCLPLSIIFNCSFQTGKLPSIWKLANVTPIYKRSGSANNVNNYRPISLTCSPCKVMESIIRVHMLLHLTKNNIISPEQFGFLPHHSTELQLIDCLNDWSMSLDNSIPLDVIYFDFSKAFDTVSHPKLFQLIKSYNIAGNLYNWLFDFVTDRVQRVCINGSFSSITRVLSGVPQGSVLGPILFLIFINDLPKQIKNSICKLFADDVKLYPKIVNSYNAVEMNCKKSVNYDELQNDINQITKFADSRQLILNIKKCVVLRLGGNNPNHQYFINGTPLLSVSHVKDLGVIVDSHLNFSLHCKYVSAKARKICGLILHSFSSRDQKIMIQAFNTYVLPILLYCSTVFFTLSIGNRKLIESPLRSFTKRAIPIPFAHKPYVARLNYFCIPSINQRLIVRDLVLVHKLLTFNNSVLSFDKFFTLRNNVNKYNTRGHNVRIFPQHNKRNSRHSFFSVRVVEWWNILPDCIIEKRTSSTFSESVKDHIFKYFPLFI